MLSLRMVVLLKGMSRWRNTFGRKQAWPGIQLFEEARWGFQNAGGGLDIRTALPEGGSFQYCGVYQEGPRLQNPQVLM
jgi:hypothetical protein